MNELDIEMEIVRMTLHEGRRDDRGGTSSFRRLGEPSVAPLVERRPPQSSWARGVKPVRCSNLSDEAWVQSQAWLAWSRSL
jgi:hypothetical protein